MNDSSPTHRDHSHGAPLCIAALKTRVYAAYVAGRSSREVEANLAQNADGLTSTGLALLHALRQGDKTLTEVSRFLPVAPSTLVPLVDGLEARGLLRRGRDPRDRRRTPLSITKRGREALTAVPPLTGYAAIAAAMQAMGEAKSQQLAALLGELVSQMGGAEIASGVEDAVHIGVMARLHSGSNTTEVASASLMEETEQ
jgi:DNA-binding MarR family transcriptional regulator